MRAALGRGQSSIAVRELLEPHRHGQADMQRILGILVALLLALAACSKEGHIDIEVQALRLDQLPAGAWLSAFEISYKPGADDPKKQILRKLREEGKLKDEFKREENGNIVTTRVWNYRGYTIKEQYYEGGVWPGPEIIPYQEYVQGELRVWITVEFPEGVRYSKLLPEHYQNINPSRKHEHTATIKSKAARARLFLFGYGSFCQRISFY